MTKVEEWENAKNPRLLPKSPTKQSNPKGKEIEDVRNPEKLQSSEP